MQKLRFKVGHRAIISGNSNSHEFKIGQEIRITEVIENQVDESDYVGFDLKGKEYWYLIDKDLEEAGSNITDQMIEDAFNWSVETFGNENNDIQVRKIAHLHEEIDEILKEEDRDKKLIEYADSLILLLTAAKADGYNLKDLSGAWIEKMKINKARKWGKPNAKGYNKHI